MRWTTDEYQAYLARRAASGAKPEQAVCDEPVEAPRGEAAYTGSVQVCVTSHRKRLIDPDNLCPKYFIDCLRYAELIRNDTAQDITLTVKQVKSKDERTEIEIIYAESSAPSQ